jgi:hypothetical protein
MLFTTEDVQAAMLEVQLADLDPICPLDVTGRASKRTELLLPAMALLVVLKNLKVAKGPKANLSNIIRTLHAKLEPILEASAPGLMSDPKTHYTSFTEGMNNVKGYTKLKVAAAQRLVSQGQLQGTLLVLLCVAWLSVFGKACWKASGTEVCR